MKLKRFVQSTILLTTREGKTLLVDPGKYNLDPGKFTLDTFPTADVVIITHKHADHFDLDLLKAMLSRSRPVILTNEEIQPILEKHGIASKSIKVGDLEQVAGFTLRVVEADHVVRGEFIVNFGFVVSADNKSLYYTSDTRFIDPTMLPPETRAEYLMLPISNRGVVMGMDDAVVFSVDLKPSVVIPMHYESPKDKDRVNPMVFAEMGKQAGLTVRVLAFGEEIEL